MRDLWDSELLEEKLVGENFSDTFFRERWDALTRNLHVVDNSIRPDGSGRDRFRTFKKGFSKKLNDQAETTFVR